MRPVIAPAVVITIFTTFKQFDIIYLLTMLPGAQTGANLSTVITYAYENAFITNNYGYSSAVSTLIFVMLITATILWNRRQKGEPQHD
jgi:arabinogalactan oligomer/maltooligosaccharide transport system permease protein